MIQLICTHCRAMLEMDDGFAGGACRCQHCGTIQTVPSHLKNKNGAAKKSRTLYQNAPVGSGVPSSGLDQLADIVASSGLSSQRLRKTPEPASDPRQQKNLKTLLIASASLIAVLSIALIYLVTRDSSHGGPGTREAGNASAGPRPTKTIAPSAPVVPNFCALRLQGDCIFYLLDRGDSTRDHFGSLKSATLKSISSLTPDRKFQILFWNNGADEAYPKNWPIPASEENVAAAERAVERIDAHGKTDVTSALTKALENANQDSEIVIVTGKAWDLDNSFVKKIDTLRGEKPVRIHTISLGDPGTSTALQQVAARSRGSFKALSGADLKEHAR